MVTRVYGSSNGVEIVFTPLGDDRWNCAVPSVPSGEYIIELYAEDDAGNIGYTATILFVVDAKHLTFKIKFIKFSENAKMRCFSLDPTKCEICGGDRYELCGDV